MEKFSPEKLEKVVITIRIPEKMVQEIDCKANTTDLSRNEFIKQCIEYALSKM